ncbi:MAG: protein-methionine-sulfoxide reductase catalytic subunit MsrP [Verrucomicrobiota bacterium]
MANLLLRPEWHIPERQVTPEAVYHDRRRFLRDLGLAAAGSLALPGLHGAEPPGPPAKPAVARNPEYAPNLPLTSETLATTYNNYYEFSTVKDRVHRLVDRFSLSPWTLTVGGLCQNPTTFDARELIASMPLEERVYRFRCVEAWSMVVPWTGFPLARLLEKVQPLPAAKFVKFQTALRLDEMPGVHRLADYPWPYTEGLRLDEAMHPLVLLATGLYGKPMPKQNGALIRLVVPWKYGFKSIKSLVRIDLVDKQPATLWETLNPQEYPFEANVDPGVPHPRWSQASECVLGTNARVATLKYNGYGTQVAKLYAR